MKNKTILFKLFFLSSLLFLNFQLKAQTIEWSTNLGGSGIDEVDVIIQTSDGGYIMEGYTNSSNGDVSSNYGGGDCWVVKIDQAGYIEWEKNFGGTDLDSGRSIRQTVDGGYVVVGQTGSMDGDVSQNYGLWDYWVIKLDQAGNIEWENCYGGSNIDIALSIQQTTDDGYIIAGHSFSNDGYVESHSGLINIRNAWTIKLDSFGELEWEVSLGGMDADDAYSVLETTDGGYFVSGAIINKSGYDYLAVKLSSTGEVEWQKSFGGTSTEEALSSVQTLDSGYILAGYTRSDDGDVSANYGDTDYWVVKLNGLGELEWEKNYGGSNSDRATSIKQTSDGGYMIGGYSNSNDGDISANNGDYDYWILKINSSGIIEWEKSIGGTEEDKLSCLELTEDDGFIVSGWSESSDGEVNSNNGASDFWLVKFGSLPTSNKNITIDTPSFDIQPNPSNGDFSIQLKDIQGTTAIQIHDLLGKEIYSGKSNDQQIHLKEIPAGTYWLTIENEGRVNTQKLIVH